MLSVVLFFLACAFSVFVIPFFCTERGGKPLQSSPQPDIMTRWGGGKIGWGLGKLDSAPGQSGNGNNKLMLLALTHQKVYRRYRRYHVALMSPTFLQYPEVLPRTQRVA